jgi:hypothetical protein
VGNGRYCPGLPASHCFWFSTATMSPAPPAAFISRGDRWQARASCLTFPHAAGAMDKIQASTVRSVGCRHELVNRTNENILYKRPMSRALFAEASVRTAIGAGCWPRPCCCRSLPLPNRARHPLLSRRDALLRTAGLATASMPRGRRPPMRSRIDRATGLDAPAEASARGALDGAGPFRRSRRNLPRRFRPQRQDPAPQHPDNVVTGTNAVRFTSGTVFNNGGVTGTTNGIEGATTVVLTNTGTITAGRNGVLAASFRVVAAHHKDRLRRHRPFISIQKS